MKSFTPPKPPRQPALGLRCLFLDLAIHLIHSGIELVLGFFELAASFLGELANALVGFAACAGVVDLYTSRQPLLALERFKNSPRRDNNDGWIDDIGPDIPLHRY